MGEKDQWLDLQSELDRINPAVEIERKKKHCIYRVPKILRDLNEGAYTPQLVSFGPYHHGKDHLKPMECHKRLALSAYLSRSNKTLAQVAEALRPSVLDLMDSYEGLEEPWTDEDKFLELMILDGCFFLEIFIWDNVKLWRRYMNRANWMDMRRLENQLPLLVLAILIEVGGHEKTIRGMGHHLLDVSKKNMTAIGNYMHDHDLIVRPATELFQAGVTFEKAQTVCYSDISFTNGVLRLPNIMCHSNIENIFLNYIAYEHIHRGVGTAVSSFVLFMDNIIDKDEDVALLRKKKIIASTTGSDSEIASFFNRLTKGLPLLDKIHDTVNVNKDIENYCNRRWHKWRAVFIQTYLSNPWVFISLLAAFLLLVLTILQTTYSIMAYYKSS
ncbi:UPF0481 protein At3g47200-like isoform X2 [Asparagus officinalis]|uniref:UPF0481 protein At3g47200-like isoform X2 n=1 Tax=Asparagus officinalis TaxID=4686 RepID=UPI00098E4771|nr:UPF0481 protein At3g47200-like isoform X2 [Asparagus officinalis]